MSAIPTNYNNLYCAGNVTNATLELNAMSNAFANNDNYDGVNYFYGFLQLINKITISCTSAILNASIPNLFTGGNNLFFGETLLINIFYNFGYQLTDLLDLIFFDPT